MRMQWNYLVVIIFISAENVFGSLVRMKRDDTIGGSDFLSNLGTSINKLVGSFLGVNRNSDNQSPPNDQPILQRQAPQQQNSPPIMHQPQIQANQDLPTLGTNSAYDRRVAQINKNRKNILPPQPNVPPPHQGPPQQQRPIQIIDQNGKLSYCTDNPADCAYLSCLAENFQHSETANNLQMAGKVFMDRNLRRAVANDPLISQAACDKVGLDSQGCQGFRQLLGIVDKFDPDPTTEQERNQDPERHSAAGMGRRKRAKTIDYDYDHVDVNANRRPQSHANTSPVGNGQARPNANNGQWPSNSQLSNGNWNAQNGNGNVPSNGRNNGNHNGWGSMPPVPSSFTQRPSNSNSGNNGRHGGVIDYSDYYENGPSAAKGGGNRNRGGSGSGPGSTLGGNTDRGYKPRDCKAIVRNSRKGG